MIRCFLLGRLIAPKLMIVSTSFLMASGLSANPKHSDFTAEELAEIKEFSAEKLDEMLDSLSVDDLPELDPNESYIDDDPEAEIEVISTMLRNLGGIMKANYLSGDEASLEANQQFPKGSLRMLRDAHPQGLICLDGKMTIYPNEVFGDGLFSSAQSFDVVSRFSSSSPSLNDDASRDIRGFAVKIKDERVEHDLVAISAPIFPTDNAKQFGDLVKVVRLTDCWNDPDGLFSCVTDTGLPNPWRLVQSALRLIRLTASSEDNGLLEKQYFSVSPYKYESAEQKVYFKFHFEPKSCDGASSSYELVKADEKNYLAENVRKIIAQKDVCFDLKLTSMDGEVDSSILETHTKTWNDMTSDLSEISLGEIRFAKGTSELDALACDNLSFSPAHTADGFFGLGSINRARSIIYKNLSTLRHKTNAKIEAMAK